MNTRLLATSLLVSGLMIACEQRQSEPPPTVDLVTTTVDPTETNIPPVPTEAASPTPEMPTPLPEYDTVDLIKPVPGIAFLHRSQMWLMNETEENVQTIRLSADDDQLPRTLARSPDGTQLGWLVVSSTELEVAQKERRNVQRAYPVVLNLMTGDLRRFLSVEVAPRAGLAWSAESDGLYVKPYHSGPEGQSELALLNTATGTMSRLLDASLGGEYDLATGSLIAAGKDVLILSIFHTARPSWKFALPTIAQIDLTTDAATTIHAIAEKPLHYGDWLFMDPWVVLHVPMAVSPQEDLIAYSISGDIDPYFRSPEVQGLYLIPRSGGEAKRIADDPGLEHPLWSPDGERLVIEGGVGDGSILLIYDRASQQVTHLQEEQWRQVKNLINPDDMVLNRLTLSPVAWLGDNRLIVRASFGFIHPAIYEGSVLLTLDIEDGRIEIPAWFPASAGP